MTLDIDVWCLVNLRLMHIFCKCRSALLHGRLWC